MLVSRTRAHSEPGLVERAGQGYRLGDVAVDHLRLVRQVARARTAWDRGNVETAHDAAREAAGTEVASPGGSEVGPLAELRRAAGTALAQARRVLGLPGVLDELAADPDPAVARLALMWTSRTRENAGDLPGASAAARQALTLVDDQDGPWTRALLTAQLADFGLQTGDAAAAAGSARQALPDLELLGAEEDVLPLRALLVFTAIADRRLDEAQRHLDQIAVAPGRSVLSTLMALPCAFAELAIARGEIDLGLVRYREAVSGVRGAVFPGFGTPNGQEPWVLVPQAAAVAAHARPAPTDAEGRRMRDALAAQAAVLLAGGPGLLDLPVAGSVVFALALWDLRRPDASEALTRRAVRLLAVADRFTYNRMLPSMA